MASLSEIASLPVEWAFKCHKFILGSLLMRRKFDGFLINYQQYFALVLGFLPEQWEATLFLPMAAIAKQRREIEICGGG